MLRAAQASKAGLPRNSPALKLMKSLHLAAQFAIESLRGRRYDRAGKEAIMLDVAFVALGLAILALMFVYAHALEQL